MDRIEYAAFTGTGDAEADKKIGEYRSWWLQNMRKLMSQDEAKRSYIRALTKPTRRKHRNYSAAERARLKAEILRLCSM